MRLAPRWAVFAAILSLAAPAAGQEGFDPKAEPARLEDCAAWWTLVAMGMHKAQAPELGVQYQQAARDYALAATLRRWDANRTLQLAEALEATRRQVAERLLGYIDVAKSKQLEDKDALFADGNFAELQSWCGANHRAATAWARGLLGQAVEE